MIHLGDITKIKGNEVPIVDCAIGGSPCQDLSMAGLRKGFDGERSVLYTDQIRIIEEMRAHDRNNGRTGVDIRPRYMVWENVPGAFSTNGGKDFAAVLEEAIRVAEPEAPSVSVPEKGWPTSGCLYDEMGKWSVAWRVLDAQFWGTSNKPLPQRRRRIALVADFGGLSAPEILFVRKSVSGDIEPGKPKGKETAGDATEGSGGAVGCDLYNGALSGDKAVSLNTNANATGAGPTVLTPVCSYNIGDRFDVPKEHIDTTPTLTARMGTGGNNVPAVAYPKTYQRVTGPLMANSHPGSYTGQDAFSDMLVAGVDCRNATENPEMNNTLQSDAAHNLNSNNVVRVKNLVRRLTPLECERLQGFPDGWTLLPKIEDMVDTEYEFWKALLLEREKREGRARENDDGVIEVWQFVDGEDDEDGEWVNTHKPYKHKTKSQMVGWYNRMVAADASRYKALGNSIALPPWKWVLKRLCACYERDATMASLFDGIGGFPLIWEQLNGKGSCLWASEIEEFPIAVTKARFGE